jgi:hypothetical protein
MSPKNRHTIEELPLCIEATRIFHDLWHDVIDPECICIDSGLIHLQVTEPPISVVFVMMAVETKDAPKIRKAAHNAACDAMEECYGAAKGEKIQ